MGPALASTELSLAAVRRQVRSPRSGRMPAFPVEEISDEELGDLYTFLRQLEPRTLAEKATWWGTDLLNLPTPKTARRRDVEVHFSHRFSESIRDAGFQRLYGLDSFAFPGFSFSYGLTDRVAPYLGRTANLATWEYGVKVNLVRERDLGIPVSVAASIGGTYLDVPGIANNRRFTMEVPIGFRVGDRLAVQAVPLYSTNPDDSDRASSPTYAAALGFGASLRLSPGTSLDGEWIGHLGGFRRDGAVNQWQAGVSMHVGNHMFQLLATNSVSTTPDFMAGGAINTGLRSNIRFGFNLVRIFSF